MIERAGGTMEEDGDGIRDLRILQAYAGGLEPIPASHAAEYDLNPA